MNLKKFGKVFTSKFVGTGPSSYKKRIYRAAVLQRLRNIGIVHYTMIDMVICATHWTVLNWWRQADWDCSGMWYVWGKREMCTRFWWEKHEGKSLLRRPSSRSEINIREVGENLFGSCGSAHDKLWALVNVFNIGFAQNLGEGAFLII